MNNGRENKHNGNQEKGKEEKALSKSNKKDQQEVTRGRESVP
jgi:hypothetical protein